MYTFSKIPTKLFYTSKDSKEKSLLEVIQDSKLILVLDYLYWNINRKDIIKFTIEDLVLENGFTPNSHKNKINDQFKKILYQLDQQNVIEFINTKNISSIKNGQLAICKLLIDLSNSYVELEEKEKQTILSYSDTKIDNTKLLMYYTYLKSRMYKRKDANYSRSQTCNPSYDLIMKDLFITEASITQYNDMLVELNLIRIANPGLFYFKDDTKKALRESPNIYTLYINEEYAKAELAEGIKEYKKLDFNSNKVFTNSRTYKNNNRTLNGKLGAIEKKIKNGTATEKDLNEKQKIITSLEMDKNEGLFKLKGVLEANKGESLSEIYGNIYNNDKFDKYYDIESNLGLVNDDWKLTVDWNYYEWVITNYLYGDHKGDTGYFKNCVKKHIEEAKPKIHRLGKTTPFKEGKTTKFSYTPPVPKEFDTEIDF